jgi:hypothetical protein
MFIFKVDVNMELRLLSPEHAEQFFRLVYENRQRLSEWMFWVHFDDHIVYGILATEWPSLKQ